MITKQRLLKYFMLLVAISMVITGLLLIDRLTIHPQQSSLDEPAMATVIKQLKDQQGSKQLADDDIDQLTNAVSNCMALNNKEKIKVIVDNNSTVSVTQGWRTYRIGVDHKGFGRVLGLTPGAFALDVLTQLTPLLLILFGGILWIKIA